MKKCKKTDMEIAGFTSVVVHVMPILQFKLQNCYVINALSKFENKQ